MGRHTTSHYVDKFKRLGAGLTVLLLSVTFLVFTAPQPAQAAANGLLDVRAISTQCGFTNLATGAEPGTRCDDIADTWYPSETANHAAVTAVTGTPATCVATAVTAPAANISGTSASVNPFECLGRTHGTTDLLASIFSGVDGNGLPDVPATTPWPTGTLANCTVTTPLVTDIVSPTCGVGQNSRNSSDYYVLEGYVFLPAVASGEIQIRASNLDLNGTARAEYMAFMASPDESFANLEFLGEAQTAFGQPSGIDYPVSVSTAVGQVCASSTNAFRLYMQDNIDGSSASLQWNLGDGNGFVTIPASNFGNDPTAAPGCTPPTATPHADKTPVNTPITFDVATDDVPGSAPLIPESVRLIDPVTGDPVDTVTVTGEGVWTVDTTTGDVTFTPETDYTGPVTQIGYRITDENGLTADSTIDVTIIEPPTATPHSEKTPFNTAVEIDVAIDDVPGSAPLIPESVRLIDPVTGDSVTALVVPGEGVWTVNTNTGKVTFTPEDGYTGTTTKVGYRITDENGLTADSTIEVTVEKAATVPPQKPKPTPTPTPTNPPAKPTTTGSLSTTGGAGLLPYGVAGALLIAAGAVTLGIRRKRLS